MSIREFLYRHPRLLAVVRRLRATTSQSVSTNYQKLQANEVERETARLRSAWQNEALPARQRALVDRQILDYREGRPVPVFDVLIDKLRDLKDLPTNASLLEIGCSSGYYSEVMEIAASGLTYTGCDYSEALVALARQRYPNVHFDVEDATLLSYPDAAFDVVVSGCCLQHIPEYETAIVESARVARSVVIFHRTPILVGADTEFFRKDAYGVETFEIHFSESQLLRMFRQNGLTVEGTVNLSEELLSSGVVKATRTYVCRKMGTDDAVNRGSQSVTP